MQSDNQGLVRVMGKDVIAEMASTCVLMRTRLISRAITGIHDEKLQPFGIGAAHFALLVVIHQTQPAKRDDRAQELNNLKLELATFPTLAEEEAKPPLKARGSVAVGS
jgi:hypothetical protein